MLAIAGAVALVLGIVGLYGVLSYAVSQRRREIAIRLALGAQQHEVRRSFLRYGLGIACIGIAIGLGAAAGVTRLMSSLLFEVRPLDVPTYAAVASAARDRRRGSELLASAPCFRRRSSRSARERVGNAFSERA